MKLLDRLKHQRKEPRDHDEVKPLERVFDEQYKISDGGMERARKEASSAVSNPLLIQPVCPSRDQGVFSSDQFGVDIQARRSVCPGGNTSTQCSRIKDEHEGNEYYRFEWGSQCDNCPLQKECTKSKNGRRILAVGVHT